jgi:hypothetical protein
MRIRSLARATTKITLAYIVYNMRRLAWFERRATRLTLGPAPAGIDA